MPSPAITYARFRDNSVYEVLENRTLSAEDIAAGVISDQIVTMGMGSRADARPNHRMRLVCEERDQ